MGKYKVERSNISYNYLKKSMISTFTITNTGTQEIHVFKNIFLAEDNKDAFLVFPSTNEEVYINRENNLNNNIDTEEFKHTFQTHIIDFNS